MKTQKQTARNTKKCIKELLKGAEEEAVKKIDKALNSGAISEKSEFREDNYLLALAILEDVLAKYNLSHPEYKKEAKNIQQFI